MKKGIFNLDLSENNETNSITPLLSLPPELFPLIGRYLSPADIAHFTVICQSIFENETAIKESLSEEQVKKYYPYISPSKPFFPNFVNQFKERQRQNKILSVAGRFFVLALEGKLKCRLEDISNVDTHILVNIYGISLEMAARQNNMDVVKNLLTIPGLTKQHKLNALCGAAMHNHLEMVIYLLTFPYYADLDRYLALQSAVYGSGDLEMVKHLLTTTNLYYYNKIELLSRAAGRGHMEILKHLLDLLGGIADDAEGEVLAAAGCRGHIEVARHLLALPGITDDAIGKALAAINGKTLTTAAGKGHMKTVEHFLHLPDITDVNKGEALGSAASNGHLEMLKYLLPLSPENPYFRKGEALSNTAAKGHIPMVEYLLTLPGITDDDKGKALATAAQNGHLEIVKCLLRLPNIADTYKDKALVCAAEYGDMAMLNYLLPLQGISIDAKGEALISAASNGQLLMVKKLLTLGEISDRDKVQAIEEANKGQYKDTAAVIEKNQRKEVITALGKHLQNRLMHTDKPRWKLAGSIAGAFIGLTAGLLFKVPLLIILSGMIVSGYVGYSLSQKLFERYQARLHKAAYLYKDLPRTIDPEEAEALKMGLDARTWRGYFTSFGKKPTYEHPAAFNAGMVLATENSEEAIKKIKAYYS